MKHAISHLLICGVGNQECEILRNIAESDLIIARDELASKWLKTLQIEKMVCFTLKDHQEMDEWINDLFINVAPGAKITYITPIQPIFADKVAQGMLRALNIGNTQVASGLDYTTALIQSSAAWGSVRLITLDGLELTDLHHPPCSADNAVLIYDPGSGQKISEVMTLIEKVYPSDHEVFAFFAASNDHSKWHRIKLEELSGTKEAISILMIPQASMDSSLESFQETIAHLRAPEDGCPWDKKQTHSSLRTYLLEETYEALDALDKNDLNSLKEELGDILLQILLHAQIASESGDFTLADVIKGIDQKIVYRHPHVFKDWVVDGEKDVIQNWETLKGKERLKNGDEAKKGMLDGVPVSYPALAQAQAIQERAARVGFDWPEIAPVLDKVMEELEEVKTAPNEQERAKELGDLLFAIVNLIRWYKVDSESALRQTNLKFRKRFAYIEEQARKTGKEMSKMTLEEMDEIWEQAKEFDDQDGN